VPLQQALIGRQEAGHQTILSAVLSAARPTGVSTAVGRVMIVVWFGSMKHERAQMGHLEALAGSLAPAAQPRKHQAGQIVGQEITGDLCVSKAPARVNQCQP